MNLSYDIMFTVCTTFCVLCFLCVWLVVHCVMNCKQNNMYVMYCAFLTNMNNKCLEFGVVSKNY